MARRVYSDFDAELLLRLSNRTDISSTQRGHALNDALRLIVLQFPHPEYEMATSAIIPDGESILELPLEPILWPMWVQNSDTGRPIDQTSLVQIEKQTKVVGAITEYYWFEKIFNFNRIADGNVNINIWAKREPEEWTSGSPEFNQNYDPMIPMKAAQLLLDTIGDQEASHIQATAYNNYAASLVQPRHEANRNDRRRGISIRTRG